MAQRKKNAKKKKKLNNKTNVKKKVTKKKSTQSKNKKIQETKVKNSSVKNKNSEVKSKKASSPKKDKSDGGKAKKEVKKEILTKEKTAEKKPKTTAKKSASVKTTEKSTSKKSVKIENEKKSAVTPKKKSVKQETKKVSENSKKTLENEEDKRKEILEEVFKGSELNEEKKLKKRKKRYLKIKLFFLACILLLLYIFYNYSYGTTFYKSSVSKKKIEIPKVMKLSEECCNYRAIFAGPRSMKSLKKEMEKIISQYEKIECDGRVYYYNREQDYTITDYGFKNGRIFNQVYITYGVGNSCSINTSFRKLELLPDDFTIEEAIKEGNFVYLENEIINKEAYTEFSEQVSNHVPAILRIVKQNKEGIVIITDLEYMNDGKFKVSYDATRDPNVKEKSILATKYDNIGVSDGKLYAYNGSHVARGYYLIPVS